MPPQGSCSIPQILDLFFSHAANIEKIYPHPNPSPGGGGLKLPKGL
jgi:hypothetical protein